MSARVLAMRSLWLEVKVVGKTLEAAWTADDYERAAGEYCASLPLEHFMESLPHSTQRKITLESFDVLQTRRPDIQLFSELLVQYFFKGKLRQVVPDNMVRICTEEPKTTGSFNLALEPVGPLVVMEWVSTSAESQRKDYEDRFASYERELKVPYCLMFYPDASDLRFWRHNGKRYEQPVTNANGRYAIPELELEVGLLDGWVRYWHRGELLPLPGELVGQVERERQHAEQERQRADQERQRADQERQRADQERQQREAAEAEVKRLRELLAEKQDGSD